jgi:hypothetical protein
MNGRMIYSVKNIFKNDVITKKVTLIYIIQWFEKTSKPDNFDSTFDAITRSKYGSHYSIVYHDLKVLEYVSPAHKTRRSMT